MSVTTGSDVYYDPYDVDIYADPYPAFRRLREEAPLYYNEQYDFYALSRFDDVERGFADHDTFSSAHGGVLEAIKANFRSPTACSSWRTRPVHTVHRGVLSRVFTPRKMNALEPQIRQYCANVLDPLVGADHFDFVRRPRRADADARDRHAARHPRAGPGGHPPAAPTSVSDASPASPRTTAIGSSSTSRSSATTSTGVRRTRPTTS